MMGRTQKRHFLGWLERVVIGPLMHKQQILWQWTVLRGEREFNTILFCYLEVCSPAGTQKTSTSGPLNI